MTNDELEARILRLEERLGEDPIVVAAFPDAPARSEEPLGEKVCLSRRQLSLLGNRSRSEANENHGGA